MAVFEAEVMIRAEPARVWEFITRPRRLAEVADPRMGLTFHQAPEVVQLGTVIDFKIMGFGRVQEIRHEVVEFEPPRRMLEKLVKGPMRKWLLERSLEEAAEGTVLVEKIEFEPPGGLLGLLVTEGRVVEQLEQGYAYSHERMRKLLESGSP